MDVPKLVTIITLIVSFTATPATQLFIITKPLKKPTSRTSGKDVLVTTVATSVWLSAKVSVIRYEPIPTLGALVTIARAWAHKQ